MILNLFTVWIVYIGFSLSPKVMCDTLRFLSVAGVRTTILPAMQLRPVSLLLFVAASAVMAQSSAPAPPSSQQPPVWQMEDSGTNASLRGIDSVDGTVAWASGTEGTVLDTTDGGAHWQKCSVPDADKDGASLDFRGVQAWDAMTAIIMASGPGDKSRLYKTTDGCKSWKLLFKNPVTPNGFFDSFYFPRSQSLVAEKGRLGVLIGDPVGGQFSVFETRDGGDSWSRSSNSVLGASEKESGAFAASNTCIATFSLDQYDIVVGGKAGSSLLRRSRPLNHKAITWEKVSLPMAQGAEGARAFSLAVHVAMAPHTELLAPDMHVSEVVVGGDYTKPNDPTGTAAWSGDSGRHWLASTTPPHGYRSTVQWSQSEKLWIAAGTNGSDVSRDDGRTWQPLDNGNWNALSLPFIVGPKGRIARLNPSALPKP